MCSVKNINTSYAPRPHSGRHASHQLASCSRYAALILRHNMPATRKRRQSNCTLLQPAYHPAQEALDAATCSTRIPPLLLAQMGTTAGAATSMAMLSNANATKGFPDRTPCSDSGWRSAIDARSSGLLSFSSSTLAHDTGRTFVFRSQTYLSMLGCSAVRPLKLGRTTLMRGPGHWLGTRAGGRDTDATGSRIPLRFPSGQPHRLSTLWSVTGTLRPVCAAG
mmetsp:Transcript_34780/g.98609  ORF Transcript_34780/g.98609 Transcript_34780/m.98609 type:complete len:222 (+) Transcript_34780:132-797(+)